MEFEGQLAGGSWANRSGSWGKRQRSGQLLHTLTHLHSHTHTHTHLSGVLVSPGGALKGSLIILMNFGGKIAFFDQNDTFGDFHIDVLSVINESGWF